MVHFDEQCIFLKGIVARAGFSELVPRRDIAQDDLKPFTIPWTAWRVWDALETNLPGTPATDDLGLIGGTFATASPSIQTGDLKAAGATSRYARAQVELPAEYEAGESVTLRFRAGMLTTVADTEAGIDVTAYKSDRETGITSVGNGVVTYINSLVFIDYDVTVTPATLSPGDLLDIRVKILVNDGGTGTAVIGCIGAAKLLCDIKA